MIPRHSDKMLRDRMIVGARIVIALIIASTWAIALYCVLALVIGSLVCR